MKLQTTVFLQLMACFFQIVVPTIPIIPDAWIGAIHAFVAFLQSAQAVIAALSDKEGKRL
jgi:hypothetical protein